MSVKRIVSVLLWIGISWNPLIIVFLMISLGSFSGDLFSGNPVSADPMSGSVGDLLLLFLLIAPAVPYLICFRVLKKTTNPALVLPAVAIALCNDVYTNGGVLYFPASWVDGAGFFAAPFLNLFIALPVGFSMGWLLTRFGPLK